MALPIGLANPKKPPSVSSPSPKLVSDQKISRLPVSNARFLLLKSFHCPKIRAHYRLHLCLSSEPKIPEEEDPETLVQELRVPNFWLVPSKALEESEWLKVTLHKWLDDEYCPEPANVEISNVAARSYYESLIAKQTDLGEILLRMVRDLETLSFQESFHGAFSAANAAVHLITQRINSVLGQ